MIVSGNAGIHFIRGGLIMNRIELFEYKLRLREYCISNISEKLSTAEALVIRAQEAANSEGKSSAGDKYETGRSMGQLEKNMYLQQAADLRLELVRASVPLSTQPHDHIQHGTIIETDDLYIFVCAGFGKKNVDDSMIGHSTILFISELSPLFKTLRSLAKNDSLSLQKSKTVIREIA